MEEHRLRRVMVVVRRGNTGDFESAVVVWREANIARREGRPIPESHEQRVRSYADVPDAFLLVADDEGDVIGMGLGMQGLEDDGLGPPIEGLCHISMVFVSPDRWGQGIGKEIMESLLIEAKNRDYKRAQLWTHADNERAKRLYEGHAFRLSGRQKPDDSGDLIVHYEREL
jgi:ribosomal protein S18 acetylase RimI-like enzyme